MKKKSFLTLISIVTLACGAISLNKQVTPFNQNIVQAATKHYVAVKGNKHVRLYNSNGKKSKYYAAPNKKYSYTVKRYLKINKKKTLAYKIGSNSHWLLAKNSKAVTSSKYVKANLKLPAGYTRSALLKAYQGKPSSKFIKASMKGMQSNNFSRIKTGESAKDNKTKINLANLTDSQQKELAQFALRLLNQARKQLKLKPWIYSTGTQNLADDIAKEYSKNNRSIKDGDHYVAGIVRACQKNGLNLTDNYVEDMAGFNSTARTMTMTQMKKNVYFGLKQMIFGYVGNDETGRNVKSNYREWEHAGDLFNTQGSTHTDGDRNYFGFSVSKTGNVYSMHYISVPSFVVNSAKYNRSFQP